MLRKRSYKIKSCHHFKWESMWRMNEFSDINALPRHTCTVLLLSHHHWSSWRPNQACSFRPSVQLNSRGWSSHYCSLMQWFPPTSSTHSPSPQLFLNPPPGDIRLSRVSDQRASSPKRLVLIRPPPDTLWGQLCIDLWVYMRTTAAYAAIRGNRSR